MDRLLGYFENIFFWLLRQWETDPLWTGMALILFAQFAWLFFWMWYRRKDNLADVRAMYTPEGQQKPQYILKKSMQRYIRRIAKPNPWSDVYRDYLTRALDALARFYSGGNSQSGAVNPWSGLALDRSLLLAVAYPFLGVLFVWAFYGHAGTMGLLLDFYADPSIWQRIGSVAVMAGVVFSAWGYAKHTGWKEIAFLILIVVFSILLGTLTGSVAFAFAFAGAGAGAGAGAVVIVISIQRLGRRYNAAISTAAIIGVFSIAAVFCAYIVPQRVPDIGAAYQALLLFLILFSAINAVFDWGLWG